MRTLSFLAATALLVAGCAAQKATPPPATLTVWADDSRAAPLQRIAAGFEKDRSVRVKIVQKAMGNLRDDFVSQAPSGQGPDVIVGPHDWLGKLVQNRVVAPLDLSAKASLFSKAAVSAMTYDGQTYGLPYAIESVALLRNTTLVPKEPRTFGELVAAGRALVKEGRAEYPVGLPVDPKAGSPFHLYALQTSFGAAVFGPDGELHDPAPAGAAHPRRRGVVLVRRDHERLRHRRARAHRPRPADARGRPLPARLLPARAELPGR